MYTNKKNVLELVALMKEHGIKDVVLCPGSRNIPLVRALSNTPYFHCISIRDERSAAFVALGICIREKRPCAVCVTSGSALLNTAPAIAEAFYQKLPLLIISGDRASSWINQMDGQTIEQNKIFTPFIQYETSLPEVFDNNSLWHCNRLCNEALLTLFAEDKGPVHINVPISDPFFAEDTENLPNVRVIQKISLNNFLTTLHNYKKIFIILGQEHETLKFNTQSIQLLKKHVVIIHEHLANVSGNHFIQNIDSLLLALNDQEKNLLQPDLIITLGGHFVSKQLKILLRNKNIAHANIINSNTISDLFCSLTYHIKSNTKDFFQTLIQFLKKNQNTTKINPHFVQHIYTLSQKIKEPILTDYNQISITGSLLKKIKKHDRLYLANSSTVRYAQLFTLPNSPYVQCNRGVNGIEGSLSTFIGASLKRNISTTTPKQNKKINDNSLDFLIIGDLSFLYDMNALYNTNYTNNLRILLINNAGGEIFSNLKGLSMTDKDETFIVAPHHFNVKGIAHDCNLTYLYANNAKSFNKNLKQFLKRDSNTSILFEVITTKKHDITYFKNYIKNLSTLLN